MSIIKEMFRNIQKNLVLDFILLIQFASCFFASTYLISYYFNIQETESMYQEQMGKRLYWIFPKDSVLEGNKSIVTEASSCIEDLRTSDKFEYMVLSYEGAVMADADVWREHMSEEDRQRFQEEKTATECYSDFENGITWTPVLQSITLDWNGYQYLNKSLKAGREFTEEDFTKEKVNEVVPIMMGSDYAQYFKVGDTLKMIWSDEIAEREVIGFLESNSNALLSEQTYLDSYIIYPSQDRTYGLTQEIELSKELYHYTKALYAWIVTEPDLPELQLTQELNGIMSKYPLLGDLGGEPRTFGTEAFKGELKETVNIIAALVITWLIFLVFSLIIILLHKIDMHEKEYAIWLMNGIPYSDIMKAYLLELAVFLIGAVVTVCIWQPELRNNFGKLNFTVYYAGIMLFAVLVILIVAAVILGLRLKRIDIEQLMRKDG